MMPCDVAFPRAVITVFFPTTISSRRIAEMGISVMVVVTMLPRPRPNARQVQGLETLHAVSTRIAAVAIAGIIIGAVDELFDENKCVTTTGMILLGLFRERGYWWNVGEG
jgi:hypothetical protein